MEKDKYPHWRDALSDSSLLVNLRCAVKYVLWHSIYLVLALIGAILVGASSILGKLGASKTARKVGSVIGAIITSSKLKRVIELCINALLVVSGIVMLFGGAYAIWLDPMVGVMILAIIGGAVVALVLLALLDESGIIDKLFGAGEKTGSAVSRGATKAGKKAVQTPGIRRIYGNCPVHFDIEPKWFEERFE